MPRNQKYLQNWKTRATRLRQKSVPSDPFKFWAPAMRVQHYFWFNLLNATLLKFQFNLPTIHVSEESLNRLRSSFVSGEPVIWAINHTSFIDPHIMIEVCTRAKIRPYWLAGIEPFEGARGKIGRLIQAAGAYSLDRGVIDRLSVEATDGLLNRAEQPLVLYPEGEADYSNHVLRPLYPGTAGFARNAAKRNATGVVKIVPVAVRYGFDVSKLSEALLSLQSGIDSLFQSLFKAAKQEIIQLPGGIQWVESVNSPSILILTDALKRFMEEAVFYLEVIYYGLPNRQGRDLRFRLQNLMRFMLTNLLEEHLPGTQAEGLSYLQLMSLKNKLRSLIIKKLFAPTLQEIDSAVDLISELSEQSNHSEVNASEFTACLTLLEQEWLGNARPHESNAKRISTLTRHIRQQRPFAETRAKAEPEILSRWEMQLNDTRRIKMIALILEDFQTAEDLNSADFTPASTLKAAEELDTLMTRLEILLFSQFRYRGPKQAWIEVGELFAITATSDGAAAEERIEASLFQLMSSPEGTLLPEPRKASRTSGSQTLQADSLV